MHPSITLLLRYRSQVCMPPCDGYTSLFKLQSQATLLEDAASHTRMNPSAQPSIRDSLPVSWVHSRTLLGTGITGRSQPLHSPQCLLESNESRSRQALHECCPSQESQFQEEPWVLLVHSPLLQQSRLLAVPPLSDMLKFGGSFHVRQVTDPLGQGSHPALLSFL